MANPTRILFVSGEVAPFATVSDIAKLVRTLPEKLQDTGAFEARIMMPRYGTISERKNRLHEVIRLSGTAIQMGSETETLKVKVASIPGIRLQVYFMDSARFFKRKGIHADKKGDLFKDNTERALFFGRSVLETLRKLSWAPDVIHAFGWISGLLPLLLNTEYANDPLFEHTTVVYTPDDTNANAQLSSTHIDTLALSVNGEVTGRSLTEIGLHYAQATVFPPSLPPSTEHALHFSGEIEEITEQAISVYEEVQQEVVM